MKITGLKDTIEWYSKNAKKYTEATAQRYSIEQIDTFVSLLRKGDTMLDAGCGPGRDTQLLTKKGLKATGLDLSSGLLDIARKTYPHIEFVEGTMLDLPFSDETFNGIWARGSLLHLETVDDVRGALKEFFRVLKKGGVLFVLVKAQTGSQKTEVWKDTFSNHERFFQYFTKDELRSLIEKAGFSISSLDQYKEIEKISDGRPEVEWILALGRKK